MAFAAGVVEAQEDLQESPRPELDEEFGQPEAERDDGPAYPVSGFRVLYRSDPRKLPAIDEILPVEVELGWTDSGFVAPRPGTPSRTIVLDNQPGSEIEAFHASAIGEISRSLLERYHTLGLMAIYVAPHPADLDLRSEEDLRRPGDTLLRLEVHAARVRSLRSVASGDRLAGSHRINNRVHRRIRQNSPLQPTGSRRPDATDLVQRRKLEDYLHQLNRHPGRRVDAALAPAEEGDGVDLDYRINDARPWSVYAQLSNTGTKSTNEWQQRYGVVHRQLTNRDDVARFEYLNAGFNDVNGVRGSYEAPWFSSRRPAWLRPRDRDAGWLRWLDRGKIPWIGSNRLRWRVTGGWSRYLADDLNLTSDIRGREWNAGGQLIFNAWQHRAFFLDLIGGLRLRDIDVKNRTNPGSSGQEFFVLPQIGARVQRVTQVSTLFGRSIFEASANSLNQDALNRLGGREVDDRFVVGRWDIGATHYLEPLFNQRAFRDPDTPWSSTLAHEIALGTRGQYSFGNSLIPQASQVVGGLFSVRGYPQSAASGDDLFFGSFEYRFHLPRSLPLDAEPVHFPWLGDFRTAPQHVYGKPDWDLILRAFFDVGRVRFNSRDKRLQSNNTLLGAGVGVELRVSNHLRVRVDYGVALKSTENTNRDVSAGDDQFHFLFSVVY